MVPIGNRRNRNPVPFPVWSDVKPVAACCAPSGLSQLSASHPTQAKPTHSDPMPPLFWAPTSALTHDYAMTPRNINPPLQLGLCCLHPLPLRFLLGVCAVGMAALSVLATLGLTALVGVPFNFLMLQVQLEGGAECKPHRAGHGQWLW